MPAKRSGRRDLFGERKTEAETVIASEGAVIDAKDEREPAKPRETDEERTARIREEREARKRALANSNSKSSPEADNVRAFVQRWVRLIEEKRGLDADIKDLKAEAKEAGVDVAALAQAVKEETMSDDKREKIEDRDYTASIYLSWLK